MAKTIAMFFQPHLRRHSSSAPSEQHFGQPLLSLGATCTDNERFWLLFRRRMTTRGRRWRDGSGAGEPDNSVNVKAAPYAAGRPYDRVRKTGVPSPPCRWRRFAYAPTGPDARAQLMATTPISAMPTMTWGHQICPAKPKSQGEASSKMPATASMPRCTL